MKKKILVVQIVLMSLVLALVGSFYFFGTGKIKFGANTTTASLIQNGDFELGDFNWYKVATSTSGTKGTVTVINSNNCYGGSGYCVQTQKNTSASVYFEQKILGLEAGETYSITAKVKAINAGNASQAYVHVEDVTAKKYYGVTKMNVGSDWQDLLTTFTPTTDNISHTWVVYFYGNYTTIGTLFYDNISIINGQLERFTVSGQVTDLDGVTPVSGINLFVQTEDSPNYTIITNQAGSYNASILAKKNTITNIQIDDRSQFASPGYSCSISASNPTPCNFTYRKLPFDLVSLDQLLPDDQTVSQTEMIDKTTAATPDFGKDWIVPTVCDGIKFVTTVKTDPHYFDISTCTPEMTKTAEVLNDLKAMAGIHYRPKAIVLVKDIDWAVGASGVTYYARSTGTGEMATSSFMLLSASTVYENLPDKDQIITAIVSHEFGHVIDWTKGHLEESIDFGWCKWGWCSSTSNHAFQEAFYGEVYSLPIVTTTTGVKNDNVVTGYASTNVDEMFAELVSGAYINSVYPPSDPYNALTMDEAIKQYLLLKRTDSFNDTKVPFWNTSRGRSSSSVINLGSPTSGNWNLVIAQHNCFLYLYKMALQGLNKSWDFVPGSVVRNRDYKAGIVETGGYMGGKAYVTFRLFDHGGRPMEDVSGSLAGVTFKTTNVPISNRFYLSHDGSIIKPNLASGDQMLSITSPEYYKVPFASKKIHLNEGSNYVETNYYVRTIDLIVRPDPATFPGGFQGDYQAILTNDKINGVITDSDGTSWQSANPGEIQRYPSDTDIGKNEDGSVNGTIYRPNSNSSQIDYRLKFLMGGDDSSLKLNIGGPSQIPEVDSLSSHMLVFKQEIAENLSEPVSATLQKNITNVNLTDSLLGLTWPVHLDDGSTDTPGSDRALKAVTDGKLNTYVAGHAGQIWFSLSDPSLPPNATNIILYPILASQEVSAASTSIQVNMTDFANYAGPISNGQITPWSADFLASNDIEIGYIVDGVHINESVVTLQEVGAEFSWTKLLLTP